MIRNAKARGWLTTQPGEFETWSRLSGIQPHEVRVDRTERKGNALLAGQAVSNTAAGAECLLTVPRDLILSLETVREHARVDADLREVLGSLGDFGNVGGLLGASTADQDRLLAVRYSSSFSHR